MQYLLAIDQGTTSSRAIVFTRDGNPVSQHQIDLTLYYPNEGWVEQDPNEMWTHTLECCHQALKKINLSAKKLAAIGITNQRETTIIWDKKTGEPIYPAIVWQDRRTSEFCLLRQSESNKLALTEKTGLLLDPYFSLTKIIWILDHIPHSRERAERGELLFGTVDTFLLWRLTKGRVHATDATNASRTLLFNIHTQQWDYAILNAFNIPESLLPSVLDSSADFGRTNVEFFDEEIPIASLIGDQQAATVGQACFKEGMVKSTFGTGAFVLLNTGSHAVQSKNKLLTTVAYRLKSTVTFGLEGSIFCAGATIKWLRDKLKIIKTAAETEMLAAKVNHTGGVYLVPAFTGLAAPFWDPEARGALLGLTRNSGIEEIVRAALEAIGFQTRDLLTVMQRDCQIQLNGLRVDGGMVANQWLLQFLADILTLDIECPQYIETTALGAAFLAGLQVGVYQSLEEISELWKANKIFKSTMESSQRERLYQGWQNAIQRVITK